MIYKTLKKLLEYGLATKLIDTADVVYTMNRLFELFHLEGSEEAFPCVEKTISLSDSELENLLATLLDYAFENNLLKENSITYRDIFDTKIMACLTPAPSFVRKEFETYFMQDAQKATNWFYEFSQNTDYIRRYRIKKDMKWQVETAYGELDITINLSKPEKDPKAIAAAKNQAQTNYPKCQLCIENEGYAGRVNHPPRGNHRIIPVTICGEPWAFQYSPYVYYNEHCILLNTQHTPMKIDRSAFEKLFDFVRQFPHYMVGSNADLPIVGGSILTHEHFQGGNYTFPMAKASFETTFSLDQFPEIRAGIVKWPLSVIRLVGKKTEDLVEAADHILQKWRSYTDESLGIFAETEGVPHNTITPIVRFRNGNYEIDLALRNNITTEEHPLGVFHPHAELHHIKKENIGLIEVMGLAILPARLKDELTLLAQYLVEKLDIASNEHIAKHAEWAKTFADECDAQNVEQILKREVGLVFEKVLIHAGVFKANPEGRAGFLRFIKSL